MEEKIAKIAPIWFISGYKARVQFTCAQQSTQVFDELKTGVDFPPERGKLFQRPKPHCQVELAGTAVPLIGISGTERFYLQKFHLLGTQIRFAGGQQRPAYPMPMPFRQNGHHVNFGSVGGVLFEGEEANRLVGVEGEKGGENGRIGHILPVGFFNAKPIRQRPQNGLAQVGLAQQWSLNFNQSKANACLTSARDKRSRDCAFTLCM